MGGEILRFGGPALIEGQSTWYEWEDDEGVQHRTVARPGDEVEAGKVKNLQHYLDSGMAELVGSEAVHTPAREDEFAE